MPYNNSSPTYRIPFMSQGEQSSGSGNRRAAFITDSQLSGVTRIIGSTGILSEGTYSSVFTAGGSSAVNLMASAQNYAFEAYIDGVYVAQNTTLSWNGLPDNSTIYLYGQTQENNLYQSSEFSSLAYKQVAPVFNTNGLTPVGAILIGIATTTGSGINLNTSSSISDSSFAQRPVLVPYNQHRTANPIDHPFHSIFNAHITDNIIRSNNIQQWDGQTSGTGAYANLSGTGISSIHLKPQAVDSRSLAPALSASGLSIQTSFSTLSGSVATLSGTTLVPGYQGQNILEAIPLQVLQTSTSGLNNLLQAEINIVANNQSGIQNTVTNLQASENSNAALVSNFSGLDNRTQEIQEDVATLGFNQSGIQNTVIVLQSSGTATLASNFSGLQNQLNNLGGRIVASNDLLAQNAALGSVVSFNTPNDSNNHTFSVASYVSVTAISAGSLAVQTTFTDENSVSQSVSYFPMGVTSATLTTTGFVPFTPATIRCKPNTSITVKTTFTGVSVTYDIGGYIAQIN